MSAGSFRSRSRPGRALLLGPLLPGSWRDSPGRMRRELRAAGADPSTDLRIGVDRGALLAARLGFAPDLAVGDWDGLGHAPARDRDPRLARVPHVTLDVRKDRSDLFYALGLATLLGTREVIATGVTGGRPDHHLASLQDLGTFALERPELRRVSAFDEQTDFHFVTPAMGDWRLPPRRGTGLVSIFAWNGWARGVTLKGFEYELRGAKLEPSSQGLSNRVRGGEPRIRVREGLVLVVVPRRVT